MQRSLTKRCLKTPLETRRPLDDFPTKRGLDKVLTLESLLNLIVRRLEGLYETYLLPIEPTDAYARLTRRELAELTLGAETIHSELYNATPRGKQKTRGVPAYRGAMTYRLPDDPIRAEAIVYLLHLGSFVGIGRSGVDGKGVISVNVTSS